MSPLVEMQGIPFKIYSNWSNSVIALMCRICSKLMKSTVFLNPLEKSFWCIDTCKIAWQIPELTYLVPTYNWLVSTLE